MKTAISVPRPLFEEVERMAKRLGISRSEFYTRAARRLLDTVRADDVTRSYNEGFADRGAPSPGSARKPSVAVDS